MIQADTGFRSEPEPDEATTFAPLNFSDLQRERPERGPVAIEGILRLGGVATIVSGPKCRKSFLVASLIAASQSEGAVKWLGRDVAPGRALLIDGELTRPTIYFRYRRVFEALGIDPEQVKNLDIFDLRGRTADAGRAVSWARSKGPKYYTHIIVDPISSFYPVDVAGFSENDNAHMRRLYDDFINFATDTQAGVTVIHHTSKGEQANKGLTDLGSGAGSISRAGDAHLALRPHREKDVIVFDGVVRDFPELTPTCWRWIFPTFVDEPDLNPEDLAGKRQRKSATEEFMEAAKPAWNSETFATRFVTTEEKTMDHLQAEGALESISNRAVERLTKQAVAMGKVHCTPGRPGKPATYSLRSSSLITASQTRR